MPTIKTAKERIKKTSNQRTVFFEDGGIPEILKVIFHAGLLGPAFTRQFAPLLKGRTPYQTLKHVWEFVKYNVEYERDNPGDEVVKSPGKLIYDGEGDCKSFTLIIISLLTNFGIPWKYRTAFYYKKEPGKGHIYPIALLPGREVVVDAVHTRFDEEVAYWKAEDYTPDGRKMQSLNGTPVFTFAPNWGNLLKYSLAARWPTSY